MAQTSIFVAAALLPALILMRYIYKKDSIESEPRGLLLRLVVAGAFAVFPVVLLEFAGQYILDTIFPVPGMLYSVLLMFLVVASAEEGCKYFFLKRRTWNHPAFNYQFDGVVYAVFVSLGFAALENIGYVLQYGLSVAITRAVLSVPSHMGFAVFMGSFYGRAKVCQAQNDEAGSVRNRRMGILIAILLHGFYNSCLLINTTTTLLLFVIFVVVMYAVVIRKIKIDSISGVAIGFASVPLDDGTEENFNEK